MAIITDIVFNPNHADNGNGPRGRWRGFLSDCKRGSAIWTGKKSAHAGDLYFFWFGEPVNRIGGIGVHDGEFHEGDWDALGGFQPAIRLGKPILLSDIHADPLLASWWACNPFMGRPKTLLTRPAAARRLLELTMERNPELRPLIADYLDVVDSGKRSLSKGHNVQEAKKWSRQLALLTDREKARIYEQVWRATRDRALRPAVLTLWGNACAACGLSLCARDEAWECEVAHVKEVNERGADGLDNALPLCRTHHWAFDQRLWAIEPGTLRIAVARSHRRDSPLSSLDGQRLRSTNPAGPNTLNKDFLTERWRARKP